MTTTELSVTGMTCAHCAMAVTRALQGVAGVQSAQVSLEKAQAIVVGDAQIERLIEAVEQQGYRAAPRN